MSHASMRDRLWIGQRWQRRRDRQIARIRQRHRPDRLTELELLDPAPPANTTNVVAVSFTELRTKWRALDEHPLPSPSQGATP